MKRLPFFAVLLVCAGPALAQQATDLTPPPPPPDVTAPPMVPTDVPITEPQEPAPATAGAAVLQPGPIANAPLQPSAQPGPAAPSAVNTVAEPKNRSLRLGMSLMLGLGTGLGGAVAGSVLLPGRSGPTGFAPIGPQWAGAAIGWTALVPLGVLLGGALFDGEGTLWGALVGDLAGAAIGAVSVLAGETDALPLMFALPLGGSILGYEATAPTARPTLAPTAMVGRDAAKFGFAGTF